MFEKEGRLVKKRWSSNEKKDSLLTKKGKISRTPGLERCCTRLDQLCPPPTLHILVRAPDWSDYHEKIFEVLVATFIVLLNVFSIVGSYESTNCP